jgi:hypothetical protein
MANDRYISYAPAAGTTNLTADFPVWDPAGIKVTRIRASVATVLVLDTDYSLSGLGTEGCLVTLTVASLLGDTYQLAGNTTPERISDYDPHQTPSGAELNADLNQLIAMIQELKRRIEVVEAA